MENTKLFIFKDGRSGVSGSDVPGFEKHVRQETAIKPGLWLSRINYAVQEEIRIKYKRQFPVIDFGFVISSNMRRDIDMNDCETKRLKLTDGISGIQYAKDQEGMVGFKPGKIQKILHIHMSIPYLKLLFENNHCVLPAKLSSILKTGTPHALFGYNTMSPEIQGIAYQLMHPPRTKGLQHLYLEGKVLELLSLQIAALNAGSENTYYKIVLNPEEKERIRKAEKLLVDNLQSPPSLKHLSMVAGLNANKLQAGFHERYGKSVFEYLREYKMQTAKVLLEDGRSNVSETAWHVGYVNVSHFSAAFKKRFGILPKQYSKHILGKKYRQRQ